MADQEKSMRDITLTWGRTSLPQSQRPDIFFNPTKAPIKEQTESKATNATKLDQALLTQITNDALASTRTAEATARILAEKFSKPSEQAQKLNVEPVDSRLVQDVQQYLNTNNTRLEAEGDSEVSSATPEVLPYPQQEHIENYKPQDPKLITDVEDHLAIQRQRTIEPTSSPDGVWRVPEVKGSGGSFASLFPEVPQTQREPILTTREDSPIPEDFPTNKATPLPQRFWGAFKKALATVSVVGTLLLSQDQGPAESKKVDKIPQLPQNPPTLVQNQEQPSQTAILVDNVLIPPPIHEIPAHIAAAGGIGQRLNPDGAAVVNPSTSQNADGRPSEGQTNMSKAPKKSFWDRFLGK